MAWLLLTKDYLHLMKDKSDNCSEKKKVERTNDLEEPILRGITGIKKSKNNKQEVPKEWFPKDPKDPENPIKRNLVVNLDKKVYAVEKQYPVSAWILLTKDHLYLMSSDQEDKYYDSYDLRRENEEEKQVIVGITQSGGIADDLFKEANDLIVNFDAPVQNCPEK